jgi:hypothetical protein
MIGKKMMGASSSSITRHPDQAISAAMIAITTEDQNFDGDEDKSSPGPQ